MKKVISFLMCALLCIGTCSSLVACGGDEDSNLTVIEYVIGDGGFGRGHADDLAEQFEKWAEENNKVYAEGKTGVKVNVRVEPVAYIEECESKSYHVVEVNAQGPSVANYATLGYAANVNDVVTENMDEFELRDGQSVTIEDKIPEYARGAYQGRPDANGDKEYYAVPGYSYAPGLTFDENAFCKYGYFFADVEAEDADKVYFDSALLGERYYFLNGTDNVTIEPEGKKSPGPDQVYGTQDDGLPSNIMELAVLCEKIKSDDKFPFLVSGKQDDYKHMFTQALYIQLMGYDQLYTWMNYDGGPVEIVTGYTNEPLFPGYIACTGNPVTQIYKPTTAIVNLTEENGYYSSMAYARYIALAFTQLAFDMGWFHDSTYNTNHTHKTAMHDFVFNGYKNTTESLMLVEMNFWYNEAKLDGTIDEFIAYNNYDGHLGERKLTWMSLPTVVYEYTDDQLLEGKKTRQVLYGTNNKGFCIAGYVQNNPELFAACKDLLRFYATDYQMNRWTAEIGISKTLEYTIDENVLADLPWYFRKQGELINTNCDQMLTYAENATFQKNYLDHVMGYGGDAFTTTINGVKYIRITDYFMDTKDPTVKTAFEAGMLNPTTWVGKYAGSKEIAGYSKDANEVEIKYNPVIPS